MSRHESDREDLMQEATGLARRVEWQVPFIDEPVVAGFKKNGACLSTRRAKPVASCIKSSRSDSCRDMPEG